MYLLRLNQKVFWDWLIIKGIIEGGIVFSGSLEEIGIKINKQYRNIRFLFEIDFSKDDYSLLKELFQKKYSFNDTYFKDDFFSRYFRNYPTFRIPFLILLTGFIRYEYLNDENQANFFDNFLKHVLQNKKADAKDFRRALIDYFFRWRGKKEYKEEGLYIYDLQTSSVSLKLEESGRNKYLNSFLFHSGGVSEKDLKEYLKIIRYLSDVLKEDTDLYTLYQNKNFNVYSRRLDNFFRLLEKKSEISHYIFEFVWQSINLIKGKEFTGSFPLPLYIRNYFLFIGKYGEKLEEINIKETDFIYENQSLVFNPQFLESYRDISHIAFNIHNKRFDINKKFDIYTVDDFASFKVRIDDIDKMFTVEFIIDGNIFKRYNINLFEKGFILLDSNYNVRTIQNKEIYIPQRDEGKKYLIITKEKLELKLTDKKLDSYFIYELLLNLENSSLRINNEEYRLYFKPNLLSEIHYEDNNGFLFTAELPKFRLTQKDQKRFIAMDLLNGEEYSYNDFYQYSNPLGKFVIHIDQVEFKVIFLNGFEIVKWFNWYDAVKTVELKVTDKAVKTNSDRTIDGEGKIQHSYKLKKENNQLIFNLIDGGSIQLEIQKPTISLMLLDKRKQETKVRSKNIRFNILEGYRQLKVRLSNYPHSIVFDRFQVGENEIEVKKHKDNYYLSLKEIKKLSEQITDNHVSIVLKNDYYFLPITDVIFDRSTDIKGHSRTEIKINDIYFLMNNSDNIKYYIGNKAYYFDTVEYDDNYGTEWLILREIRETKKKTTIKKNFRNVKEDGIYVELKDIDYE